MQILPLASKSVVVAFACFGISVLYAQQVYKSVDKQGRVTYSQVPPKPGSDEVLSGASSANPALPYALQQAVNRFPVTLYSTKDCSYCVTARVMLTQRGVPFTEKSINSAEDFSAFKQLGGENYFPSATIGTKQLNGYDETLWISYLDAAAYPKTSMLPRQYINAAATPLVNVKKSADKSATPAAPTTPNSPIAKAPATPNTPPVSPVQNYNNPTGIRF